MKKIMHLVIISCLFLLVLSLSSCASPTQSNLQQGQASDFDTGEPRMWGPLKFVKNTVNKVQSGLAPLNKGEEVKEVGSETREDGSPQDIAVERTGTAPVRIYAEAKKKILGQKEVKQPIVAEKKTVAAKKDVAKNIEPQKNEPVEKRKVIGEGISSKSPGLLGWYMYQVENSPLSPMRKGGPGLPQPVKDAMSMQGMKVE